MSLPAIQYGPGTAAGSILTAFTRATDPRGNGVEGGPLDGFVFQRGVGSGSHSWSDGVEVSMAGCGCAHAHQPNCGKPDPTGGWVVRPVPAEGEEPPEESPEGELVKPEVRRLKNTNCPPKLRIFRSFPIFYPEDCDTATEGPDSARLRALSEQGLEAYTAYMMGHELATGYFTGNPSLQSEADDITQAALNPSAAVGSLLDGWYDLGMPGSPMVAGRPSASTIASAQLGNPVRPLDVPIWAGIPGASAQHNTFPPHSPPGTHDGTASKSTMYLHGQGFYAMSPVMHQVVDEDLAASNPEYQDIFMLFNKKVTVAERRVLIVWHTCTAIAQDVDPSSGVCC